MANKGRYKKYTEASANYKKGQSAIEYLITYGWAVLLAAISILILYIFVLAPSAIAPNTCSFVYGAYCQDMILGSNSISSKIALFLTNTQRYPIVNPQVSINISSIGTVNGKCLPNYVLPGGAIICNVTLPTTAISTGTLVSGKLYLSAIPCQSGNVTACSSSQRQTYIGNFNSHASPLLASTTLSISLTATNTTATIGIPDELVATVKLLGYPISGATVNFTANKTAKFNPNITTTDSSGDAYTELTSLQQGKIKIYASFGNVSANTTINFLQPVYITFNVSKMYNTTQTVLVVDGSQYSYINLPVTFAYSQNSKHTYAFYSPIQQGSAGNARYVYYSISGCNLNAQQGILIARSNCTVAATYKMQYYLSMVVNPSGAGSTIPPMGGNNWYYSGSLVYIIAIPYRSIFQDWTGSGTGSYTGNSITATVVMNSPITEQANFYSTTSTTSTTTSTTTSSISTTKTTTSISTTKTTTIPYCECNACQSIICNCPSSCPSSGTGCPSGYHNCVSTTTTKTTTSISTTKTTTIPYCECNACQSIICNCPSSCPSSGTGCPSGYHNCVSTTTTKTTTSSTTTSILYCTSGYYYAADSCKPYDCGHLGAYCFIEYSCSSGSKLGCATSGTNSCSPAGCTPR